MNQYKSLTNLNKMFIIKHFCKLGNKLYRNLND